MKAFIDRFIREDEGQNLVEYALLAGLVALVALAAIQSIGTNVNTVFGKIRDKLATIQ